MGVLHPLQHLELIVDHLLVSLDILLEDNLHGDLASWPICFSDNTICTSTERPAESIFSSAGFLLDLISDMEFRDILLIIAFWLAVKLVEHIRDLKRSKGHGQQTFHRI